MVVFGGTGPRRLRWDSEWGVNTISTGKFQFSPYYCKSVSAIKSHVLFPIPTGDQVTPIL